ncbi:putative tubulin-specific chaperone [Aspergillus undulatus]|uniref:putative tubulin-specific chaperone n=1 Tax=Aspergillus undulatus TaxID=1810928 RepID=UPI003CCCA66A
MNETPSNPQSHPLVNQRRSYDGNLCTIRYVGKVEGTTGEWLGVEWDDPTRGKHSGQHQGVRYFTCSRTHPTAGSFVRPSRPADKPRSFLEALREKYANDQARADAGKGKEKPIKFKSKIAEEVGFDKIRRQLAELEELKIVLLDGLRVTGVLPHLNSHSQELESSTGREEIEKARAEIERTCPKIVELDLSVNVLTRWRDVADICEPLKRLRLLRLSGNRFGNVEEGLHLDGVEELHLDDTLLPWEQVSEAAAQFPSLTWLSASANQIATAPTPISNNLTTLVLENNDIASLSSIKTLKLLRNLKHLSLRGNCIDTIFAPGSEGEYFQFSPSLQSVDLSRNKIDSWLFINSLPKVFPGLQNLRVSGNALFNQPVAPSSVTDMPEKPMTVEEAYMLTLSRLSNLQVLNYSTISAKDRSNGELYYLSLIGKELSASPETAESDILKSHPRYNELCKIYGEPLITRASKTAEADTLINPRSVAARLVRMVFRLSQNQRDFESNEADAVRVKEIPRSYDTYQVKAIVSRLFNLTPFEFRLIWETDELDPVSKENMDIEDEWDSEDESDQHATGGNMQGTVDAAKFVKREVELVDTTKDIGFWFQPDLGEARVRVEVTSR